MHFEPVTKRRPTHFGSYREAPGRNPGALVIYGLISRHKSLQK